MKNSTLRIRGFMPALLASWLCMTPVWSDDTDIFFGDVGNASTRPNVLFIIDTSGSMSATVDGTGKDRLDNVKDAMYQLLDELGGVNVGLMRFTNPGGPILYPVTYIDADAEAGAIINVQSSINRGSDDAQELNDTGQVMLDNDVLQLGTYAASGISFDVQVNDKYDDAEETVGDGAIDDNDADLRLRPERLFGVRFLGVDVPATATILNAYIRFTGDGGGDATPINMQIWGQDADSGNFNDNNVPDGNISNRRDIGPVAWNVTATISGNQTADTPNLASIVQGIIADPGWTGAAGAGEDDMVFIFDPVSGGGRRDFYSHEGSESRAPQLFIEYIVGVPGPPAASTVGLRFDDVRVPRGATITSAYLQFTADRDVTSTYDLALAVEDSVMPATYTTAAGDINARDYGATTIGWAGTSTYTAGESFNSPDLSALVQGLVNRTDWCGGNPMAMAVRGAAGTLPVWAYEGSASLAPRLVVNYEQDSVVPGSSCIRRTLTRGIASSSDDAEEAGSNVSTTGIRLDMESGNVIGLRFADLPMPRNAVINDARIEFTSQEFDSGNVTFRIYAEQADDAAAFVSVNGSIEDRPYYTSYVDWPITSDWSNNGVYRTPDISSLVSTVVGRGGWSSGNAMAVKVQWASGGNRDADTYNENPSTAPRLIIDYVDDGTGVGSRKVRDVMRDLVSDLNHNGWTPVQDTLYEAALYYTGQPAKWGATRGDALIDGGPFNYARISSAQSMVPGTFTINRPSGCSPENPDDTDCRNENISVIGSAMYDSPIDDSCQEQSHIILLTDGDANRPHSTDLIPTFMGGQACLNEGTDTGAGVVALQDGEQCVKDLVRYMNENDMATGTGMDGVQRVTTHTIGFNFSSKWLADVATAGGGVSTTANNATELVAEIKRIVGELLITDTTFVAPVAAVNEFNQLSHLKQVYFATFRPDERPRWAGNLKRYTLGGENGGAIVDANGMLAIDENTGFFRDNAQSFWSATPDGDAVEAGGAASVRPAYASRNVYTYYAGSGSTVLSNGANRLVESNLSLTKAMFGVGGMTDAEFAEHIQWIRGRDVDDEDENGATAEDRYYFGDPLHSRPVAITYGGDEDNPDVEIYFGSNAGSIQAINATDGRETFAFFPEEMLPLQADLRANQSTTRHYYGIDGTIAPWSNDNGRNGIDLSDAEDFVRLYTGMRRGGRNYYALDVTDRANPEIMWTIKGGEIQANADDFRELGQTWSRPIKTQIVLQGDSAPRDVLIFSGGYDPAQDDAITQTADTIGRAMYIVDALSGNLIWAGGKTGVPGMTEEFSAMDYSFPSTPSVVDVNQDGLADGIYIGDTGGQLWRFDIKNGEILDNLVTGGVIGDLGDAAGVGTVAENRRFFGSPSIALVRGPEGPELSIAIGSGFRPSPLRELATNRMFMVRQKAVFSAPSSYTRLTAADLYDATSDVLETATGTALTDAKALLAASQGWYFNLTIPGEKVLSSPLIANERVIFTTYTPGSAGVWCEPAAGTSRAYSVRLEDAVRQEPRPLLTPSIVDQASVIVPPPPPPADPNEPEDPNNPPDPNEPPNPCPLGNNVVIKLNTEDGPVDEWCNNSGKTYWIRER